MNEVLRPHVVLADGQIYGVAALPGGGFAVATGVGIELFDARLAPSGTIRGASGANPCAISDDRVLVHDGRGWEVFVGTRGGELAKLDLGGSMSSLIVTARGFIAVTAERVITDVDGARVVIEGQGSSHRGGVRYRDGAAIVGGDGLIIVDAMGELRARSEPISLTEAPVVVGERIVVPTYGDLVVFDGDARELGRVPQRVSNDSLVAFGNGILARDSDAHMVTYWDLSTAEPRVVWTHKSITMLASPVAIGRFAVLPSFDASTMIFDETGLIATLPFTGWVRAVAPFEDGIAFAVDDLPALTWWRRSDVVHLPHDVSASGVVAAPAGVASYEGRALYSWRTDVQGPEPPPPVRCEYPIGVPLIIGGRRMTIAAAGRQSIRGVTPTGSTEAVSPGLSWRTPISRDEATAIVERLAKREFAEVTGPPEAFCELPPAELVDLYGRSLVAPATLSAELNRFATDRRWLLFDEVAWLLDTSPRALVAALKVRKMKLVPPRPVPDYDYLGTFTTSGALTVCDPCYRGNSTQLPAVSMSKKVVAADGIWHVFMRNEPSKDANHPAELAVVHDTGFDVYASELIANIAVDSGCVGVFDKACPKIDLEKGFEEGVIAGLCVVARTGGDAWFPLFAGSRSGKVVKLRVSYGGDTPEIDQLMVKLATVTKPYSASAKFALGDTIIHVKFGPGSVIRVGSDGKIDVRFADGTRTLVHGKR